MKRIQYLFFLLAATSGFAQVPDIVKTDGIANGLHQNNIGKIVFLPRNIPLDSLSQADFLKTHELTRQSNLNIRVFMDNSIINYQHELAPGLTAEQLNVSGNYQFTFLVDQKPIYKENIHYGCGLRKTTTTTFRVPLTDTNGADFWSIYLFDRFLDNGGKAALSNGNHLLRIEIRPYLKIDAQPEVLVGELIASGEVEVLLDRQKISADEIAVQTIKPTIDFKSSSESFDIEKIKMLNKEIATDNFRQITSIVVIKNGKILLEEYFNDAKRETLHDTRSVGKSFTSTLMGIAIGDGFLKSENQTLGDFYDLKKFANYSPEKENIKLRDLLTMSSAFDGSDEISASPGNEDNMYPTPDWVKFALDLPLDPKKKSGEKWEYFTAGVILLGDILNKSVPDGLEKYADLKLFKPLGISNYKWEYTPQNVVNTAGGLRMNSLDFAKVGQLYKNGGTWNGKQILPKRWVEKSLAKQIPIASRENEFYGFLFWNKTYKVGAKNYETFYCAGNGGNKIFVFKDLPLVIVVTAKAFNRPYAHLQVDKMISGYLLPAILNP